MYNTYNILLYGCRSKIELQISDSPLFRQKFAAVVTISAARVLYIHTANVQYIHNIFIYIFVFTRWLVLNTPSSFIRTPHKVARL